MRSRLNLPILVMYIVLCTAVMGLIVAQLGVVFPWQHPYSITANFPNAAGILSNNEVEMNGVKVGHVGDVTVRNGSAWVQLIVDDNRALPVYQDATAEVRKKNLLGETYIDLQRGSNACTSCQMQSGAILAMDHTIPITEIDQVLAIFDPTTVQRVQLLLDALGQATTNRGADLNAEASTTNQLVTELNGPAVVLATRREQINDIVLELQKFYDLIAKQRAQIRDEFGTWNQVMGQLAQQEQSIGTTLSQADTLLTSLNTLLANEGPNLRTTIGRLPGALNSTSAFLDQTNGILSGVLPYRGSIHDIFPHLASSFADTDVNGQHFWSVYSTNCNSACGSAAPQASSDTTSAPSASWAAYSGGGW